MLGPIPARTCRHSHSKFSVIFSKTRLNKGYDPLNKPPTVGTSFANPGPTCEQLALIPQPKTTQNDAGILFQQCFGISLSAIHLDILLESFCQAQENLTSL